MTNFQWALIGPGAIARRFADAVQRIPGSCLNVVHGRDAGRAEAFARRWSLADRPVVRVSADIDALLSEPDVDAVYIATPHSHHGDAIAACLAAGKPVLCEKPLVPTLAQALPLIELARQRQVFLMEAIWTRFLPIYEVVGRWLTMQAIGPVRAMQSSFCFSVPFQPASRMFDPALAGGALLDIGIYNLTMTHWVLQKAWGACPEPLQIQASGRLAPTGVDQRVNATLIFPDGIASQFVCAFDSIADNGLRIFGERGVITVPQRFWEATEAILHVDGQSPQHEHRPFAINGFEGEIAAAQQCIRAGLIESPVISHRDTLTTLGWMDQIRQTLGVRYPFEQAVQL
jgi:predicted dehydrogenase